MHRRELIRVLLALAVAPGTLTACARHRANANGFRTLEQRVGGRLGVCLLDTGSGEYIGHRLHERFALCSTFKALLAALVLQQRDRGELHLDKFVRYTDADMVPYAPVTSRNLKRGGMSVGALAEAAQQTSDNVAANLLLKLIGGPAAFTAMLRASGDRVTRLDRYETALNVVPAGEVRDTTSPLAMARSLHAYVIGEQLSTHSKTILANWMRSTKTGQQRLRAGLPSGWSVGNKTGTAYAPAMANKTNDVAVVWPPAKSPHVITAYYEADGSYDSIRDVDQATIAEVGRLATHWIQRPS